MSSHSVLVLTFIASVFMSQLAAAQGLGRIERLERIAADLGALGMTSEAASYQTKAANERVVRERQAKAAAQALEVSQLLANQIGQFQNAMTSGKFGRAELQSAARKLKDKYQQLGKYITALETPLSAGREYVASQNGSWPLATQDRGEIVRTPAPTVIATPAVRTPAIQPTPTQTPQPTTTERTESFNPPAQVPSEFPEGF